MNITSIIAKVTRRIHSGAVSLHLQGLRATVKGAELRAKRASYAMMRSRSIADAAMDDFQVSVNQLNSATTEKALVAQAAQIEARHIGGSL